CALLAPFGALVERHVDLSRARRAPWQLALQHGETDAAHRIAPAAGIERAGRGENHVADMAVGRGLDAPAVAGAALQHPFGVGDALRVALLALHPDQRRRIVAELLQRDLAD